MIKRTINILILTFGILFDLKSQTTDTINITDSNGKKQGQWIITGKNRPGSCFKPDQKAEEGRYKDNRKTGVWTEYFCNSNIKNILTFKDGRPEGPAKTFYENGKIKDDGTWLNNRWVGKCKMYSEDGKVQEYIFDQKGKREGPKIYPFENGTVIEGRFSNSPDSVIKEYSESHPRFNDGAVYYEKVQKIDTNEIYILVDSTAKYKNGIPDLMKYIMKNFIYPNDPAFLQTKTTVKFVVSRQGIITNAVIYNKTPDKYTLLDKEMLRVFTTMAPWTPAIKNGTKVKQELTIPVQLEIK